MPSWLIFATLLSAAAPSAKLDCSLQKGATWNEGSDEVSAVRCNGRKGFFVPSAEYRRLIDVEENPAYKLLEKELKLAEKEIASLRKAISDGDGALEKWKDLAKFNRKNWLEAEDDVQAIAKDVQEAARRKWYESDPLWFTLGALTVAVVWYLSTRKDSPTTSVIVPSGLRGSRRTPATF